MDHKLENKTALVTASTWRNWFCHCCVLSKEGATVYINGRSEERVLEAIDKLKKKGVKGSLKKAPMDLSSFQGVHELSLKLPTVDILVNNLGIYEVKPFEEITDEEWLRIFEINVLSGVRLSRIYLPRMKERNWGRIIFISSESGINIPAEMIHYGVTKTAQISLARGLAEMTAGTGVTVNSILPGPTLSEGVQEYINQMAKEQKVDKQKIEEEFFEKTRPSSLLKRFASPDEVAAMVAFICSPLASAVNGAALRVEGGVIRSIV